MANNKNTNTIEENTKSDILVNDTQITTQNTTNNDTDNTNKNVIRKNTKYKNLDILTAEEARKRGRAGGKKSGEVRKARKTMRDTIIDMLSQPLTSEMIEKYGLENVKPGDTMQEGILAAAFATAMSGDIKAAQYLRDTAGEQPTIKQDIRNEIVTKEDLQTIDNVKKLLTS